jgi:hypothetical protein
MFSPSYMSRVIGTESGNDPFARNPRSSATGLGQFTDGTWRGLMQLQPELGLTADGRTDPVQSKRALEAFTAMNANSLKKNGIEPSDNNLYAMHRFGESGGLNLLRADPNASIDGVVSPQVLQANPDLTGKTVGQVLNRWPDGSRSAGNFGPAKTIFAGKRDPQTATDEEGFLPGGPGGLIGLPNGVTSGGYDVGGAMAGAGAALASIGDAHKGAALAQLAKTNDDQWQMTVNPASGSVLRINKKTGKVEAVTGAVPQTNKGQDAYDVENAKLLSKQRADISDNATKASVQSGQLDQLGAALSAPGVYQGSNGEAVLGLKKAAQAIGFNIDGIPESELANKISKQMALELRNPAGGAGMPGALSDSDRKYLTQMTASLDNSPEGNQRIIQMYKALNKRSQDVEQWASEYEQKNGGRLDAGFRRFLAEKSNSNPLFDPSMTTAPAAAKSRPPLDSIFK